MNKQIVMVIIASVVVLFAGLTIRSVKQHAKNSSVDQIVADLALLSQAFNRIDQDCQISGFDEQQNSINFLNVVRFVGIQVGPMKLAYASGWKGPYLADHPTFQGKEYQVVSTKKGYFITPGNGVVLPTGKTIGTDIVLDKNADIQAMANSPQLLHYNGNALAVPLVLKMKDWQKVLLFNDLSDTE